MAGRAKELYLFARARDQEIYASAPNRHNSTNFSRGTQNNFLSEVASNKDTDEKKVFVSAFKFQIGPLMTGNEGWCPLRKLTKRGREKAALKIGLDVNTERGKNGLYMTS